MSATTKIEWCDSTLNLQMGCNGCELWNPTAGVRHCYAGQITERYAGAHAGFPPAFGEPRLFLERLDKALAWSDLTGRPRPEKPWLDGLPRVIFLDDMGDTFTESLPRDWLAPLLPRLAASPHVYLLLTKRPRRMAEFAAEHPLPDNVWPGTSVTSAANLGRLDALAAVRSGGPKWLSAEPLLGPVFLTPWFDQLQWVIAGGESGPGARPLEVAWVRDVRDQCVRWNAAFFFKQWGSRPGRLLDGRHWDQLPAVVAGAVR